MLREADPEEIVERPEQQPRISSVIADSFRSACLCCFYYYAGRDFTPAELAQFGRQAGRLSHSNVLLLGINGVLNYTFPSTACSSTNTGLSCFTFLPFALVLGLIASILEYAANQKDRLASQNAKDRQQNQNQAIVLPNVLQGPH